MLNTAEPGGGEDRVCGESGFTLIEVLVALAVFAVSLTVLFDAIANSARYQTQARTIANAGLVAQSILAEIGTEHPLREGQMEGTTSNGFRWRQRTEAYGDAVDRSEWPIGAYTIEITVFSPGNTWEQPAATLKTLRLATKANK